MKVNSLMASFLLAGSSLLMTGCQEDFAKLNIDQGAVSEGNVAYLFSQGVLEFEPSDYTYWLRNAEQIYEWMQLMVPTDGVSSTIFDGGAGTSSLTRILKYLYEIKYVRSQMSPEESAAYATYEAALDVLCIYIGIFDSDFIGDIPYTEAGQALHGGTLTPKYDRIKDLYDLWLKNLDADITVFTTAKNQKFDAVQDPVYGGQPAQWAKLANSLKLKIATRLISQNRGHALNIAKEVGNASCGYIDSETDDFLFNKATNNTSNSDFVYHFNQSFLRGSGVSKSIMDLMINNRDPRVRFIFEKNDWNSKVVQLFFDAGRQEDVPQYILDNVEYTVDTNGKYHFKSWKAPGEPWVRYYGLPLDFNAGQNAGEFGDWFNYQNQCKYDDNYTYIPFSQFQMEMVHGRVDFTLPVASGDPVIQDTEDNPWYGMYMSTAEVNLYLAEFKLLGADLPKSAEEYYNTALHASVKEYDRLAKLNHIPYYGTNYNYDPNEKAIDLQSGEIEEMMSHDTYQLIGTQEEQLEKVYVQQILHFMLSPVDVWVTCRRSGVPKFESKVWKRIDYQSNSLPVTKAPRRTVLTAPSPTDLMYHILMESYKVQGYSIGSENGVLNSERTWQDQGAPQYGEGPKL